ncbi:MAG: type II secretion system protein GspG [Candidatus Omnitrophica bacterium]|nr:type II secretion system protein GspG [Candidatus Omnitrophota bacterium]
MALVEILVSVAIIFALGLITLRLVASVAQKSKSVGARAQIAQLALLLESVKDDTSLYPVFLQNLASTAPPNDMQKKGWHGFYTAEVPLDPWENAYFYQIPPTTVLPATKTKPRTTPPSIEYMLFEASPGKGTLLITNYGTTANRIWLNGIEVVHPSELKNNPKPQIIEKEVDLLADNVFEIRLTGGKNDYLFVEVSGFMPTDKYFILGSYGKDGKEGGEGYNKDITWRSDTYPNFQRGET